ncbi:MAG: hypothetical protein C5B52_13795 [Bacteroidetes bacterium]|nr:MAG: hypothetical protein C5B52_13795 [Bacteroidota bacterium]
MKKLILISTMFLFAFAYANEKGTWTGWISDSHCGVKGNHEGHTDCAKKCVKGGADAVFVVGDKVYTVTDQKKVLDFLGDKVTITGTITDDKIDVEKISKDTKALN